MLDKHKVLVNYDYSGYESISSGDIHAGIGMMKDAVEEMGGKAVNSKKGFGAGILKIAISKNISKSQIIDKLKSYDDGEWNPLGEWFDFD